MAVPLRKPMRGRLPRAAGAAVLCACLCSCVLILGLRPLSVTNWHPHDAAVAASSVAGIWVEFSDPVDLTKAEQALSLSENGVSMPGSYSWQGNRLSFTPARAVSAGNDYEIAVVATVETMDGNSLAKDFRFAFTTKAEAGRPTVLSTQPADGSRVDTTVSPLLPVVVTFSEPIDEASFIAAFSVSPDPGGTIVVTGPTATFTPLTPWTPGTECRVAVTDVVKDLSGNRLPVAVSWRFTAGTESVRPAVIAVRPTVSGVPQIGAELNLENLNDSMLQTNAGFEATWGLEVEFSEPVSRENIESFLDFQPAWSFTIDPGATPRAHFLLVPAERFVWGTLYSLTIKGGVEDTNGNTSASDAVYTIRADGPSSEPPKVEVVRFRTNPEDLGPPIHDQYDAQSAFAVLSLSNFTPGDDLVSYFDVYVRLADGAAIDPFSVMSAFGVTATNGAALIEPVAVTTSGFSDPQPAALMSTTLPTKALTCVRVFVNVTNTTLQGIVTLAMADSLTDTAGNKATAGFSLPLLK